MSTNSKPTCSTATAKAVALMDDHARGLRRTRIGRAAREMTAEERAAINAALGEMEAIELKIRSAASDTALMARFDEIRSKHARSVTPTVPRPPAADADVDRRAVRRAPINSSS